MRLPMAGGPMFLQVGAMILALAACSGATDTHNQLGASDQLNLADPGSHNADKSITTAAVAAGVPSRAPAGPQAASACPAGKTPSPAMALREIDQRCLQLRQEGEVWQRTRKLAVLNRGDAGGRMADLHTPWTKDNVAFYIGKCGPRQHKSREQTLGRMDPQQSASGCA